jgi:hypothetical protein
MTQMHPDKQKYKELTDIIVKDFYEVSTELVRMNFGNEPLLNDPFTINSKINLFNLCQSVAE